MKRFLILWIALVAMGGVQAQNGSPELSFPTLDPQALAMGGTQLTSISGSHPLYGNTAATIQTMAPAKLSTSYYGQSDFDYYAVSGFWRFNPRNAVSVGWRQYLRGSGNNDSALDVGYARQLSGDYSLSKLSVGITGRYARLERADENADALAVDLSLMWSRPVRFWGDHSMLRLGAKVANLGGYIDDTEYDLPIEASLGGSIDSFFSDVHEVSLSAEVGYHFTPDAVRGFEAAFGVEYNLMQLIQLRAGYHYGELKYYYPSYASVGAGLRLLHIRVDFAYLFTEKDSPLDNTYSISFGLDF